MNNINFRYMIFGIMLMAASGLLASGATSTGAAATPWSCSTSMTTIYVGHNVTCGKYTINVADLGQPNASGVSAVSLNIYYNSILTNTTQVTPKNYATFKVGNKVLTVYVNNTFAGLYAYQKWVQLNATGVVATKTKPPCTPGVKLKCITTLYVNTGTTYNGITVQLNDLGQPNANGISPASISIYYKGVLTNITQMYPGTTQMFRVARGHKVTVDLNSTFAGLYAYQKWAKIGYKVN